MTDAAYLIEVQIDEAYREAIAEEWVRGLVEEVLRAERCAPSGVTVVITGDDEIRALNREFLGNDAPTDVLSFPIKAVDAEPFIAPDEETAGYLGDVIISYPTAVAQAAEQGHTVMDELALLVVHGCLHLLGYDHTDEESERLMWARQGAILARRIQGLTPPTPSNNREGDR